MNYPECEKLAKVKDASQIIGEFLEWLGAQGIRLHERPIKEAVIARMKGLPVDNGHCILCGGKLVFGVCGGCNAHQDRDYFDHYYPIRKTIEQIIAQYFEIDLNKVEEERRLILEEIRKERR